MAESLAKRVWPDDDEKVLQAGYRRRQEGQVPRRTSVLGTGT